MIRRHWRPPESRVPRALIAGFMLLLVLGASAVGRNSPAETHAPPRIPLGEPDSARAEYSPPSVVEDPLCTKGCIIRVPADAKVPSLWSKGNLSYVAADAALLNELRNAGHTVTVAWPSRDTVPLYVLTKVRNDQEMMVASYGTVRDSSDDVRLIVADRVPLHISELYAAGIWVEKLAPACDSSSSGEQFSREQTLTTFSSIGASPDATMPDREFDSPGTVRAAEYLFCRFAEMGYAVHYDDFFDMQGGHQVNVVADPPNVQRSPAPFLITAHYDTVSPRGEAAPGADDNASGITVMLDQAHRLAKQDFPHPVSFVAFGAEEPGLLGSTAYAARLKSNDADIRAVVNLDSVGIPNEGQYFINGDRRSRWIYLDMVKVSTDQQQLMWMTKPGYLSDDEELRRQGFPAVMVATHIWGTEPVHHTPNDRVENVDFQQIADISDLIWRWVEFQFSS